MTWLLPRGARASQDTISGDMGKVHPRKIGLENVVRMSQAIFVVRPLDPLVTRTEIAVEGAATAGPHGEARPFVRAEWHFGVVEILLDRTRSIEPAAAIVVYCAHVDRMRRIHEDYYVRGISRHWIREEYDPADPPAEREERIVFLRSYDESAFQFATDRAEESIRSLKRVRKVLPADR